MALGMQKEGKQVVKVEQAQTTLNSTSKQDGLRFRNSC